MSQIIIANGKRYVDVTNEAFESMVGYGNQLSSTTNSVNTCIRRGGGKKKVSPASYKVTSKSSK